LDIIDGRLEYNDEGKYVIADLNLSDLLDKVYYGKNNKISLRITNGNSLIFQENSTLYKNKNKYNFYSYFVAGADLETALFDNVGKEVTVEVDVGKDYAYSTMR